MRLLNPVRRVFSAMRFSRTSSWFFNFRHRFSYDREVGDAMDSSTVAAPVLWFARNFPEAPPALWDTTGPQEERIARHLMLDLLQRPNDYYTGPLLWWATTIDWLVNGNGYWIVVPNRGGTPIQLWWTPSWMMKPRGDDNDSSVFISYYEYTVDGEPTALDPRYVVHFRYGLDEHNPRCGCSPLKSVLREVFTDNEAADFTASLLRNMGVPGLLVSPEAGVTVSDNDAKEAKKYLSERFTGERRGEPLVQTSPTKIQQFGFSPEQLLLKELRRIPEERVTAVLGIPAVVAGLGAGLDRSTFTNMAEAREAAYESGLIPAQKILGEDVRFQLLPLFGDDAFKFRFGFDLSKVRVLQEDLYRQAMRHGAMVRDGYERVDEARLATGLPVEDSDRIYLRPANVVEVPADGGSPRALAPASGSGNGNGNGAAQTAELVAAMERVLDQRELTQT